MAGKVTMIPPTISLATKQKIDSDVKRRVAGYARVSTDSDEQFTSYEAQVDYYTKYIKSHADWELVDVYTDEGISGLSTKKRSGFNQMVSDALAGRFTLIVTKSVSRFARNTVDSLSTIRKLKDAGCEVYFEKENIWTFDGKGELLLTIMSSLAQEESRSISENVTWGQRKRFADGKVSVAYSTFLGYQKGENDQLKIVPEEAKIVREIYDCFLSGMTVSGIARRLTEAGIATPMGKSKWSSSTVASILTNEKYKGDARLQKTFTVDFLQKKTKINEGEVPQYYVEGSHEAIIEPVLFDQAQEEMERRRKLGGAYSGKSVFSSRLVCGDCGHFLGSKVWHSTSKYRRTIWQCNYKFKGEHKCTTPHWTEDELKEKFLEAYNSLLPGRKRLIDDCRAVQAGLTDSSWIPQKRDELLQEMEVVQQLVRKAVVENSTKPLDQDEYNKRRAGLIERYELLRKQLTELQDKETENRAKADAIGAFISRLKKSERPLEYFDEMLWREVVDCVIVHGNGTLTFRFQNGTETTV